MTKTTTKLDAADGSELIVTTDIRNGCLRIHVFRKNDRGYEARIAGVPCTSLMVGEFTAKPEA